MPDVLAVAQRDAEQWRHRSGVLWGSYLATEDAEAVLEAAKKIVVRDDVQQFYAGICMSPAERFYEMPKHDWTPHMERFHAMYILSQGRGMGTLEKLLIKVCRSVAPQKCMNKSGGGEGIHRKSTRFSYVAVRLRNEVSRTAVFGRRREAPH